VVVLLTGAALLCGAGTAIAHDELTGSDPKDGSSLPTGPSVVSLAFSEPVKQQFVTVTVVGPDGSHFEGGPARVEANTVHTPLRPLGPAGLYTVGYRIVSTDGHPVSGAARFTLTQPGLQASAPTAQGASGSPPPGAPATAGQPPAPSRLDASPGSDPGSMPVWPWVVGGVLMVGAAVLVAVRISKGTGG
jgi:copper resistance protein C